MTEQSDNKYQVSHYPQIPCEPFVVRTSTLEEAVKIYEVFAFYDMHQLINNIKPDYSNATYIEKFVTYVDEGTTISEWEVVDDEEIEAAISAMNNDTGFSIPEKKFLQDSLKSF